MATVSFRNVSKKWEDFLAVDNLSLEIEDGEFLVILGPSGCGKTTSMRMIAGLETASEGTILIGGDNVSGLEPGERDVAMVFQSYSLYPQMTVYENICFPLRARKVPSKEHAERVKKAAELVELTDYLDRKPGALSGGQRQRVALARAIVRSPRVFLMDEPLSNLDARLRVSMRAQIKQLHNRIGTTTVYVTHDQLEAMTLADRVVVMNRGRIEQIGTPHEIYDTPRTKFVAAFVGSPAINLVDGKLIMGHFRSEHCETDLGGSRSADVTLGVRPEDLRIAEGTDKVFFSGTADNVELIGDATLLTIRSGSVSMIAKADKDCTVRMGEKVDLALRGSVHLFDQASGARLDDLPGT